MLYRLKKKFTAWYFATKTKQLDRTPPLTCVPTASCEIHTMLGVADLRMYLLAIKSLLRFHREVAVLVHSDGTLDEAAERLLQQHVPGCQVIHAREADARAARLLKPGTLMEEWRRFDVCYRRLIDTELWSSTPRRIILDSDILFYRRPDELIEWTLTGKTPFVMGQPPTEPDPGPKPGEHMQRVFVRRLTDIGKAHGSSGHFLDGGTGGFYGCVEKQLSLERLEGLLKVCLQLGIPMNQWGSEQCLIVYLLTQSGAQRLDTTKYINFVPDCLPSVREKALLHFFGTHRFYKGIYPQLASEVVQDMLQQPAGTVPSLSTVS